MALALSVLMICAVISFPLSMISNFADTVEDGNGQEQEQEPIDMSDKTPAELKALIKELEESLEKISTEKTELYKKLEQVLANKEEIESRYLVDKLEADAKTQLIELRIEVYNDIIAKYDALVLEKQNESVEADEEFHRVYDLFSERLRQSYEEGIPSTLEIFFRSESFIEMLTSIERMSDIMEHDREVLAELEELQKARTEEAATLNEYKESQKKVIEMLNAERADLEDKLQKSLEALDIEKSNVDEYIHLMQIAEKDEELMDQMLTEAIKEYYSQLGGKDQREYKMTEEYKRRVILPEIIEKMEEGAIMKGSEYFDDGETYIWPLPMTRYYKGTISSRFGMRTYTSKNGQKVTDMHTGYDLSCAWGTEIYAARSGRVVEATYNASYGYYIGILHDDGTVTRYAHCSKLLVSVDEDVLQGENIALVGATGNATGNHLHFEVRVNDKATDPSKYVVMPTNKKTDN